MSQTDLLIRAFEPDDIVEVTELLNQPRAIWGTLQLPYASVAERRKNLEHVRGLHLVAVIEGKVIGEIGLMPVDRPRRAHAAAIGMAGHDAYPRRGAGNALMAGGRGNAGKGPNHSPPAFKVWADNARAIALYERFGFEREGLLRRYAFRDGAYVDSIPMARLRG